jgi:hypothetical protein
VGGGDIDGGALDVVAPLEQLVTPLRSAQANATRMA